MRVAALRAEQDRRQAAFSPNFQTGGDGFSNILEVCPARGALSDAAGDGRTFHNPSMEIVPVWSI